MVEGDELGILTSLAFVERAPDEVVAEGDLAGNVKLSPRSIIGS